MVMPVGVPWFSNCQFSTNRRTFLPADGVYVADVVIDGKRYRSMTSLETFTFGDRTPSLGNIIDFEGRYLWKIEVFG